MCSSDLAPGSAVIEPHHMKSRATNRLRQIEVLLVARVAMQENDDGMSACAAGEIHQRVELRVAARDLRRGEQRRLVGRGEADRIRVQRLRRSLARGFRARGRDHHRDRVHGALPVRDREHDPALDAGRFHGGRDRKSTRLNSSH